MNDKPDITTPALLARPTTPAFWNAYLNYDAYRKEAVWEKIGGNIGREYARRDANTCAARVSYGLNYGGSPVEQFDAASMNFPDQSYNGKPGDGKRYIVSAREMARYLRQKWGAPDHEVVDGAALRRVIADLSAKCAVFASPSPPEGLGHAGVLKAAYEDPHVLEYLPVDVWLLR